MILEDRILGCLLGGACGDALGAPVEFLSGAEIERKFGPSGITEFVPAYGVLGAVTDDTQMSLFTVDGLIRSAVRGAEKGIVHPPSVVHHAYLRWLATQERSYDERLNDPDLDGWLIHEKRLWASRAPGMTCLSSLRASKSFGEPARNNSKGCGTVMRDAPVGFVGSGPEAFELARETARSTHGHPSAAFSSAALASMIGAIASGHDLLSAVRTSMQLLEQQPQAGEVSRALHRAIELSGVPDWRIRLPELGEGWVAEEALAIAVLCALAADGPREAIIAAVNHGGDSDSTGAIAGNLVGTFYGPAELPDEWAANVELRDVTAVLARDLAAVVQGRFRAAEFQERYPGW